MLTYVQHLRHIARHDINLANHALNHFGAFLATNPGVFLWGAATAIFLWVWLAALTGRKSASKGQSFWYGFFLSMLAGPIVGAVFAASLRPAGGRKRASGARRKVLVSRERVA